jgi:tetratricopeptide (TPR) repeat protein
MSNIKQADKYYRSGNYQKVLEICKNILAKKVDFNALRLMGLCLYKKNLVRDALAMYEYAEQIKPNHSELKLDKVNSLIKLGETANYKYYIQAAVILRNFIKENPDNFRACKQLKDVYQKLFFYNNAEKVIKAYLDKNPESSDMLYEYYSFLTMFGRFDEAKTILDRAASLNPVYLLDFTWGKFHKDFDPDQRIEQLIKVNETIEVNAFFKSFYYLSRALAHQKKKEFETAFKYFQKANNKYRSQVVYDFDRYVKGFNHCVHAFSEEKINKLKEFSASFTEPDIVPVFIVGLPRSGSTLIESILCAHDEVQGVGEINDFRENLVANLAVYDQETASYSYNLNNIDKEMLLLLRDRYLKQLKAKDSRINKGQKSKYLVNKMLTNFQYMPLIKAMFPNAKIIHAKRHPIDMMWSSFKIFFNGDDNYIYNLTEAARHYNLYREMTDHWHKMMGDDVLVVDHQKLTSDPQKGIEELLNYCDLDWNDKCLNFHKEVKQVKTASFEQVRNPITHKERMAWQDYEPYLDELIKNIRPQYLEEFDYKANTKL